VIKMKKSIPNSYGCWKCEHDQRTEYHMGKHAALSIKAAQGEDTQK